MKSIPYNWLYVDWSYNNFENLVNFTDIFIHWNDNI